MLPLVTPDGDGRDIIADSWKNRTLLATVGAHWIPPIPFTVTVSDVPTKFKALATSSVTRVVSAPLSNKQLTVSRCPFAPVAMAFTPRILASNTRVNVSSLGSDRVFFAGGGIEVSDGFGCDVRRTGRGAPPLPFVLTTVGSGTVDIPLHDVYLGIPDRLDGEMYERLQSFDEGGEIASADSPSPCVYAWGTVFSLPVWTVQGPQRTGLVLLRSPGRSERSVLPSICHIDPSTGIGCSLAIGPPVAVVRSGNRIPWYRDLFRSL
ncbi:putative ferredoxin [Trichinella spiralis]|uniref:putative ferredoxin n=1 Tax=Trichinella spiralis TaxID=6334 RepID=UPI0001EFDA70|nr:putative ferredoxin [Trichinella spiralis]